MTSSRPVFRGFAGFRGSRNLARLLNAKNRVPPWDVFSERVLTGSSFPDRPATGPRTPGRSDASGRRWRSAALQLFVAALKAGVDRLRHVLAFGHSSYSLLGLAGANLWAAAVRPSLAIGAAAFLSLIVEASQESPCIAEAHCCIDGTEESCWQEGLSARRCIIGRPRFGNHHGGVRSILSLQRFGKLSPAPKRLYRADSTSRVMKRTRE